MLARKRVIAIGTAIADNTLQDFMREHGLIRRSTKYTTYIDLNKTLSLMSDLKERLSEAKAREDGLNQALKEKEAQLKDVKSKLLEAEGKIKTLEKSAEARERELKDLQYRLSDASSKLSTAESRIKELERQLKERRMAAPESSEL